MMVDHSRFLNPLLIDFYQPLLDILKILTHNAIIININLRGHLFKSCSSTLDDAAWP